MTGASSSVAHRKPSPVPDRRHVWSHVAWAGLFAVVMGLLEAICVIYLRRMLVPAGFDSSHRMSLPYRPMEMEIIREACTLVMLVAVAWTAGFNVRSRVAFFFFLFGVWDILYYVGLKWLADWPSSWLAWDCLFLIPKRWYGPVLAPVLISGYFVVISCLVILRETRPGLRRLSAGAMAMQLPAWLLWYASFVKDTDRIMAHGYGGVRYSWLLFALGLLASGVGFWLAMRRRTTLSSPMVAPPSSSAGA